MNSKKEPTYVLYLAPDQAHTLSRACEFYSRIRIGQLKEIPYELGLRRMKFDHDADAVEIATETLRQQFFPEVRHRGASLSIRTDPAAERAWNIYQAIRYKLAWEEHPEGGCTVDFYEPIQIGNDPIPKCEVSK